MAWKLIGLVSLLATPLRSIAQEGTLRAPPSANPVVALCPAEYADDFERLSVRARDFESRQEPYTFCVRTSAVYECPAYGADGSLKHFRRKTTAHGTAFAYRRQQEDTLLATNDHVAEWPSVTDDSHVVEGVPSGCKRVSDSLKIVDNDDDDYERDDIPLSRVVTDPSLDLAVLKARQALPVMPWKMGRSAALHERNVVDVRGFPLGAFKANNVGKVISAFNHDDYKAWEHDDFVIDALLSPGNSGSPVFAISCATGEFELVGLYHAGYTGGSALNLVVGIDQARDLLTNLKRSSHPHLDSPVQLALNDRALLTAALEQAGEVYFPLGPLTVALHQKATGALFYEVFSSDFPAQPSPIVVLEDTVGEGSSFGTLGGIWFGGPTGLKEYRRSDLDAETQGQLEHLLEALRRDGLATVDIRERRRSSDGSRQRFDAISRMERSLRRTIASRGELSQAIGELAARLRPSEHEHAVSLAAILAARPESENASNGAASQTLIKAVQEAASSPP